MNVSRVTVVNLAVGILLLASPFLVAISSSGIWPYDPWWDVNDDGVIDIGDLARVSGAFGTFGESITKASVEFDSGWLNIIDKCGQNIEIIHDLNTTDVMVDITGKVSSDSGPHQMYLGLTGYTQGWSQTYGGADTDYAYSVVQTSDGGYALAGETYTFSSETLAYLVKTDAAGTMQWNKTYGGASYDCAYSVVQTSDGGYALAGSTNSFGSGGQAYLVKTDASGTMQWSQHYGGANSDSAYSVVQTSDGGYALAGSTYSFGSAWQAYLVKTNAAGVMQWSQHYGGADYEGAYSVVQTSDGGYALAGYTGGFVSAYPQAYLVKTDAAGIMEWSHNYGGTWYERAYSVVQTSDGGYALAGYEYGIPNIYHAYLVKTNSTGHEEWSQIYGSTNDESAYSLVQTSDGGYALAGYTESFGSGRQAYLVKTDASGTMQWSQHYGGASGDYARSLVQTLDGGYALAGYTASFGSGYQAYLVKTDAELGLCMRSSTDNTISLYRGATDPYWNYVRVRVWKIKETP